ncbi:MAG TPA: hypothetical protein PLS69_11805, partial [Terricaulis sp.]|nr:hypothetical protein [Terricaulis sp.]
MSKRKRELTTDEKKLWRRVAEGVRTRKPLPPEPIEEAPAAAAPAAAKRAARPAPAAPKPARTGAAPPA